MLPVLVYLKPPSASLVNPKCIHVVLKLYGGFIMDINSVTSLTDNIQYVRSPEG